MSNQEHEDNALRHHALEALNDRARELNQKLEMAASQVKSLEDKLNLLLDRAEELNRLTDDDDS